MAQNQNDSRKTFLDRIRAHAKQKTTSLGEIDQNAEFEGHELFERGQESSKVDGTRIDVALAEYQEVINQRYRENTALRARYARKVLCFMYAYFSLVMIIIFLQGFSAWDFRISDIALTTLIGSAFVSAVGLVGFVIQGLFPKQHDG